MKFVKHNVFNLLTNRVVTIDDLCQQSLQNFQYFVKKQNGTVRLHTRHKLRSFCCYKFFNRD